jgi:hypothetical protein
MNKKKLISVVVSACAVVGVTAAIAQASSTTHAPSKAKAAQTSGMPGPGGPGGPGPRSVHSVGVVLDKAGTAFITQTTDDGTIQSVDSGASTITIVEGTKSVTYKTVTLGVPANASVTLDGKTSSLGSLAAGDHVSVSSSSDGTTVMAGDSSSHPEGGPGMAGAGGPPPGQSSSSGASQ